jgi:hypothetical protein
MRHHTTLLRAAALATAVAAPSVALAEPPTEEIGFYYSKITFSHEAPPAKRPESTNNLKQFHLASHDQPAAPGDVAGSEGVRKGAWILDTSRIDPATAPASKPKEIVVVGSKPPVASGPEQFRPGAATDASRREHADFFWVPSRPPAAGAPAAAPAAIVAPAPKPQPYTPIELLPLKGRR